MSSAKNALSIGFALALGIGAANVARADDRASAPEAESMVKQAIVYIKDAGSAKAYADFTAKDPKFIDRDLYVVVYGLNGVVLAHGQNPKLVGQDLSDAQDVVAYLQTFK